MSCNVSLMAISLQVISLWLVGDYNVDRFGKPKWRWVVKVIAEEGGGSNPALAERIARQHPLSCKSVFQW